MQQCQSKSTNKSTGATSTVDADRLFHLGMTGKKAVFVAKHQLLRKELTVYNCDF